MVERSKTPVSLSAVVERLSFDLRKRWRSTDDKITVGEDREIIVAFVEKISYLFESCFWSHPKVQRSRKGKKNMGSQLRVQEQQLCRQSGR